ncbi:hypothetical protein C8Q79DRAFT_962113 [Trametes meyenii]|nr:hypothetical protein C8Q79DRAFT_962113 [Trametes meyenii]
MRLVFLATLFLACASSYEFCVSAASTPTKKQLLSAIKHGEIQTTDTLHRRASSRRNNLQDTCVYLNYTSILDINALDAFDDVPLDSGSCLCLRGIPGLVTDSRLASFVDVLGGTAVAEQALHLLVSASPFAQVCSYPPNSQPHCTGGNICGYRCNNPFTTVGNSCVNNHVAGRELAASPTPLGILSKSRLTKRAAITNFAGAQSTCAAHETVCGAYDRAGRAFQCIDVNTSLESCGGCTVPNPFNHISVGTDTGVDCSAIPHVDAVSCTSGICAVRSCRSGWKVNEEGTGCAEAPTTRTSGSAPLGISGDAPLVSGGTASRFHGPDVLYKRIDKLGAQGSSADHFKGTPGILSEKKPHEDWVRIPDIRSEDYAEAVKYGVGGARGAPKKIQEDWVRIPDIRRA